MPSIARAPRTDMRHVLLRQAVQAAGALALFVTSAQAQPVPATITTPDDLAAAYAREVDRRLNVPADEQIAYAQHLSRALAAAGVTIDRTQLVLLVDRSAQVQAALLWWWPASGPVQLIGASPVSTGRPRGFEHFATPLGVFDHTLDNPDFRAEGTPNELGICGYGRKGMRVYDFGWVMARRGWAPGEQLMRLQLHATDPDRLEPLLGQQASKGCVRVPATLDTFIDRRGVLDAAYEAALAQGRKLWVLRPDREPTPWSGRYLVVIDTPRAARPDWAALPPPPAKARPRPTARAASAASPGASAPPKP